METPTVYYVEFHCWDAGSYVLGIYGTLEAAQKVVLTTINSCPRPHPTITLKDVTPQGWHEGGYRWDVRIHKTQVQY